ncbi:MAG: hypothetical protein AB9846_10690 [Tenuifilaceae bacterium]
MDNQIQQVKPSDEIDLIELFNRMGKAIRKAINWILEILQSFFFLLLRKSMWIVAFSILGAIVGYSFYKTTPRFYSSEMVARSNSMNNNIIINSINLLNDLFENANYNALSNYLSITPEQAKSIKSIKALYGVDLNKDGIADFIDEKVNLKDTSLRRLPDIFYLRINVYDETVFPFVRDGAIKYISSNKFIQQNNELRKSQSLAQIATLKDEIKKLDSLQKYQYFIIPKNQKSSNNQMIVLNEKESKLYHGEIIGLKNQILGLERDLTINPDPITVIQDFTQLSKAENPLMKFLKVWVLLFAVLGFFTSILWQFRSKIWSLIHDKQY